MSTATPQRPGLGPGQYGSRSNPDSPTVSQIGVGVGATGPGPSASSSQPSREDQVVYRFYVKTVGVLVDSRLTHYGSAVPLGKNGERKKDRWFNLTLPEVDLHKSDLQIYRSVSLYPPTRSAGSLPADPCTVPPLLVAFILDTSDLPSAQALMWNRASGKMTIDMNALNGKGKRKEEQRSGIVLERWTFRASTPDVDPSSSQSGAHVAYRLGILHFRALFSLLRLLPAYRLFRRLRRANNGLRLGIKLWGPEGYPNSRQGLAEAWELMERGLVGLDTGLHSLVSEENAIIEEKQQYELPALQLFGNQYALSVDYRPEVDFHVEDLETVLSEKFVDMDEDFFTPTVSRGRLEEEARSANANAAALGVAGGSGRPGSSQRRPSNPSNIPFSSSNPSPIPQRQQPAHIGSFSSRPSGTRLPSAHMAGVSTAGTSSGAGATERERWGALAEGLPFAGIPAPPEGGSRDDLNTEARPISGNAAVANRRLSGHSIHPFTSVSPSTSLLRSTPPQPQPIGPASYTRPPLSGSKPSSIGRTSSFLSQSGRSFTHAQLANMHIGSGSASPPVTGAMSGFNYQQPSPPFVSPVSPSSLSFSKQPIPRSISGRPPYFAASSSSPFIPGSLERDSSLPSPPGVAPQLSKRYSQRQRTPSGLGPGQGSQGSSGDGSLPGSLGTPGLARKISTRQSQESGLRHSLEAPSAVDDAEIQAFLKTLDTLPQPPSVAAQSASLRSHLPSTSSSLSHPSISASPSPQPSGSEQRPREGSPSASALAHPHANGRTPMTRASVDESLRKMAGSFSLNVAKFDASLALQASRMSAATPAAQAPSPAIAPAMSLANRQGVGLLSASRPSSTVRGAAASTQTLGGVRRPSLGSTSRGPTPLADPTQIPLPPPTPSPASHLPPSAVPAPLPPITSTVSPVKKVSPSTARSLPGQSSVALAEGAPVPPGLRSAGLHPVPMPPLDLISPQTTGGSAGTSTATGDSNSTRSRRGPVLLRGGFGDTTKSTSGWAKASSSPSHSPIRDFGAAGRYRLSSTSRDPVYGLPGTTVATATASPLPSSATPYQGTGGHRYSPSVPPSGGHATAGQGPGAGRTTAPSSYAYAPVVAVAEDDAVAHRGRAGRVASEGGTSRDPSEPPGAGPSRDRTVTRGGLAGQRRRHESLEGGFGEMSLEMDRGEHTDTVLQ